MYTTLGMFMGSTAGGGGGGGGGFPTLISWEHGGHPDGSNANRIVAFPGGITAGQLIVIAISMESGAFTASPPSGFTRATTGANVFYRVALGGETSATVVISSPFTATNESALVFSAGTTQIAAAAFASTGLPDADPPSLTVPWGAANNLFMAIYHMISIGSGFGGTYPSNCPLYRSFDNSPQSSAMAGQTSTSATFNPDVFATGGAFNTFTIGLAA